ncbi:hypothetical protein LGIDLPPJ_00017 [Klebsiella phage KP13-27]|nr:hypothetical protein LGIDLPPJ_00017 [Klebsiella phage KP13-27]
MKFGGYCAYCGQLLPEKGWHANHVEAVYRVLKQDMKAAKKGLWKLKATGKHYREQNDTFENYSQLVHLVTCSKRRSPLNNSVNRSVSKLAAPGHTVSISALLNASDWFR